MFIGCDESNLFCAANKSVNLQVDESSLNLVLAKAEDLGCMPMFNLWQMKYFRVLPFFTLLNMEGRCCEVEVAIYQTQRTLVCS